MIVNILAATNTIPDITDVPSIQDIGAGFRDISTFFSSFFLRMQAELLSGTIWLQLGGIVVALVLGFIFTRILKAATGGFFADLAESFRGGKYEAVSGTLVFPLIASAIIWLIISGFVGRGIPVDYMRMVGAALVATLIIRTFALTNSDPLWRWTTITLTIIGALLAVVRLFTPTIEFIDSLTIPLGEDLSLLDIFKVLVIAVALVWGASFFSRLIETRLSKSERMTPSVRGLFGQLIRILMIGVAIFIALNMVGIDLTAFAVFTGALGVGIGFGLQSIFSNFVAGIIIILEKTLKVGDFVDLESGITGEVREINVRSTLITTNDNIDMLVPNSEFINKRVINWTLREAKRRMHVPVGVAYGTDKDLVKKAILEAADNVEFTLKGFKNRKPDVWLVGFGDSSLDFELIVWLTDEATKKPGKVHATYCWEIETALTKYGITIPFPQRDLHLVSGSLEKEKGAPV
ncbi:mechanosensitive ion channel family protein [Parasphingorhabdus sp.]|jgi:potassium efflux system protein|uniref:mechanosensitive ion channel family protein n=1 Tax=Parasphingorhabdus sp. TaxID=2709688 RepID=UPI003002C665